MPITRKSIMVEPKALRQLETRLGRGEAAKALGLSTSAFNLNSTGGQCRQVTELAARHILSRIDKDAASPKVLVTRVPADRVEMVQQFLDAVGAKHQCV